MPPRASALFADAFFAALRVRQTASRAARPLPRPVGRRHSSSAARTARPSSAPPPPPSEDDEHGILETTEHDPSDYDSTLDAREPRFVDVVDNLLVDFTEPLPNEPLLVGRNRAASKGFLSVLRPSPHDDELKAGMLLLNQLRDRAAAMEDELVNPPPPPPPPEVVIVETDLETSEEPKEDAQLPEVKPSPVALGGQPSLVDLGEQPAPIVHDSDGFAAGQFWTTDGLAPQHIVTRHSGRQWTETPVSVPENSTALRTGIIDKRNATGLKDVDPGFRQPPVSKLAHGLDRVLFNPGVHWLRDPHSGVYNFDPYLQTVPEVRDFDFDRLHPYVRASEDNVLHQLAVKNGKQYAGSSSSLTGMLSHIYRLVSGDKDVEVSMLSSAWARESRNFTASQCAPVTVKLKPRDGVWLVDGASGSAEDDERHILLWMGTMLEKFFTRTPDSFRQLLRGTPRVETPPPREAYRFSKSDKFLMRGQLDCVDRRLPGTGVFDLKTRASVFVRLDRWNMEDFAGYEIVKQTGLFESFEREVYDLTRSAFLKYTMQARIGNMDGCLVAYHNTAKVMGFEYFTIANMEERLYGSARAGDKIFKQCVRLLEEILDVATSIVSDSTRVRLLFDKIGGLDRLDVYIDQGPNEPMALLHVDVRPLFNDTVVDKAKAVVSPRPDWKLKYTIMRSTLDPKTIKQFFEGAESRQDFGFPMIPGKSRREMEELYKGYSVLPEGHAIAPDSPPVAVSFYPPTAKVKELRRLAREGHARILATQKAERNKRFVVWSPDPLGAEGKKKKRMRRRRKPESEKVVEA